MSTDPDGIPRWADLPADLRDKIRHDGRKLHDFAVELWQKDEYTENRLLERFREVWTAYGTAWSEAALHYLTQALAAGSREVGYPITIEGWMEGLATIENGLTSAIVSAFFDESEEAYKSACEDATNVPWVTEFFPTRLPEGDYYEERGASLFGRMLRVYRLSRENLGHNGDLVTTCWERMPESLRDTRRYAYVTEYCRCFRFPEPGTKIHNDEYFLETLVGVGGMGLVYRAMHKDTPRAARADRSSHRYALKMMRPDIGLRGRFVREGQRTVQLTDRRFVIVKHTALGHDVEIPFFTMDYVEGGKSLTDIIDRYEHFDYRFLEFLHSNLNIPGKFTRLFATVWPHLARTPQNNAKTRRFLDRPMAVVDKWLLNPIRSRRRRQYRDRLLAAIVKRAAEGVDILHNEHKLVHGDLKPGNILISTKHGPLVGDLGLSRVLGKGPETFAGTPAYSSPEQATEAFASASPKSDDSPSLPPLTPRSDVYQLGAMLYRGMTGRAPFKKKSPSEPEEVTLQRVCTEPLQEPRKAGSTSTRDLEAVCIKALQREPENRYATAAEMADDLGRFVQGKPVRAGRSSISCWLRTVSHSCLHSALFWILIAITSVGITARSISNYRASIAAREKAYQVWLKTEEVPDCIASSNQYRTTSEIPQPKLRPFSIANGGRPQPDYSHVKFNKSSLFFDLSRWKQIPEGKSPQDAGQIEPAYYTRVVDLERLDDKPEHNTVRFQFRTEGFDVTLKCMTHPYWVWGSIDRDKKLGGGAEPTLVREIEVDLTGVPRRQPVRVAIQGTIWNGFQRKPKHRQWAAFLAPNNLPEGELAMKFPPNMKPRAVNEPGLYFFKRTEPEDKKKLVLGANFNDPSDKPWWVWRPRNLLDDHVYQINFPW